MEKEKFYIVYILDNKYNKRFWDKRFVWVFDSDDDADDFLSSLSIFLNARYTACLSEVEWNNHSVHRIPGKDSIQKSCYDCEYFDPEIKDCSFVDMYVCFSDVGCNDYKKKES